MVGLILCLILAHSAFELFSACSCWVYLLAPQNKCVPRSVFLILRPKGMNRCDLHHIVLTPKTWRIQAVLGHGYSVLHISQFRGLKQSKDHVIGHHSEIFSWHKTKEILHIKTCWKTWSLNTHTHACTEIDGGPYRIERDENTPIHSTFGT